MPRSTIELDFTVEHLSILDEHGNLDQDLEPDLPPVQLIELYRAMLLGRRLDERMLSLQRQGRIGTFPPIKGQEAAQLGAVFNLRLTDWLVPAFREAPAEIWRGRSLESIILYYNGYNEGTVISNDQKDLPMAIPVGTQILHATGIGYAINYRQTDEVVMCFLGDGATSEGDFHEGLNCAAVYQTPVIFICQNNQWAISVPLARQTRSQTIAQKALAYGMPGIQVDGNDVLAVYAATKEAVQRARSGGGPTLIECVTYRIMMHTTADDPSRYRTEEEVRVWEKKDPLVRYEAYLEKKGVLPADEKTGIESSIKEQIQNAVERAEEQMKQLGEPLEMFDHLYAERPLELMKQRAELARDLSADERKPTDG